MIVNPDHAMLKAWRGPASGRQCSPVAALLDLHVDAVDRSRGGATLRFTPPAPMRVAGGAPNAIAVGAMLDFAMSFAALAMLEPPTTIVTATLRVERIASSSTSCFEAEGLVVARNDTTLFVRATLRDETARLVALSSATLRIVDGRA